MSESSRCRKIRPRLWGALCLYAFLCQAWLHPGSPLVLGGTAFAAGPLDDLEDAASRGSRRTRDEELDTEYDEEEAPAEEERDVDAEEEDLAEELGVEDEDVAESDEAFEDEEPQPARKAAKKTEEESFEEEDVASADESDPELDSLLNDEAAGDEGGDEELAEGEGEDAEIDELLADESETEDGEELYAEEGDAPKKAAEPVESLETPSGLSRVTNLEFKVVGDRAQIRLGLTGRPRYRELPSPETRQIVYVLENTQAPEKFQRAYDTREFQTPVGLFTLLQDQGRTPTSKLIVQLRADDKPSVRWGEGGLVIEFSGPNQRFAQEGDAPRTKGGKAGSNNYLEENIYAIDRAFTGQVIQRLEIKDSDVQDVLRLIARSSGYNIVIGDDVTGKVGTLSLSNIPWDQAFTLVLQSKKLGYIRQGNVLRVASLSSLKAEKDAALANEASKLRVEKLKTVLVPVSYADAQDLAARAKAFLSERGKIDTDQRTNTVIVRDVNEVTTRIQRLLTALDTQPPRVAISARIIEMVTTFSRQIGFASIAAQDSFSGVNIDTNFSAPFGAFNTTTISSAQLANLNAQFKLGQLENKVQILANPQVTAVNNQKANVTQSITQFLPESVNAGGVQTSTFKEIKANLLLDVTPIVAGDGSVFMKVVVTNEVPSGPPENKQIDTRSVTTQVLVENGDTAVIGGIYNSTRTNTLQGIPWLMKIPILGFFASNQTEEDNRNEILVFLTPKILNAEESFRRKL